MSGFCRVLASGKPEDQDPDKSDIEVIVQDGKPDFKEPGKYAVLLHNDHYTTMDFVIEVLQRYFHKTNEEALQIMLKVHHHGKGVAGIFSLEIAETKVSQVTSYARSKGFPLLCSIEPA